MGIGKKIRTFEALRSTLNLWEVLAVNRYKKYSSLVGAQLPYFLRLQEVLEHLCALYPGAKSGLLRVREERSADLLILTSDRGYLGDFIPIVLRRAEAFIESRREIRISLFLAGRRGALRKYMERGAVLFEEVLTKDVSWEVVERIRDTLVERYRKGMSDACYVIFQRPRVEGGKFVELERRERKDALVEESPFFYAGFSEVLRLKPKRVVETGGYGPVVVRFLPPDIKGRYSKTSVLNLEVPEEELMESLLELYLSFFMREIFLEHFASLNFARYRTISRILENIDRKLRTYRLLVNKLRQERITKEIQDIVFSLMATEEEKLRDYREDTCTLEVDRNTGEEIVQDLRRRLEKLGFGIGRVEKRYLLGGFRLLMHGKVLDLSVKGLLRDMARGIGA